MLSSLKKLRKFIKPVSFWISWQLQQWALQGAQEDPTALRMDTVHWRLTLPGNSLRGCWPVALEVK